MSSVANFFWLLVENFPADSIWSQPSSTGTGDYESPELWHGECLKPAVRPKAEKGVINMFSLIFWSLFLIAYAGFSVWLAKTLLNGIFLAVARGERTQEPVRVPVRREPGR